MIFDLDLKKINYLKIYYKDRAEVSHCAKAAIKRLGELSIFACAKFEEGLNIVTPQDIDLTFVCVDGAYKGKSTLKFIEREEPFIFFNIQTPKELTFQQNREYYRVPFDSDVKISFWENEELKTISVKSCDISANGIRVKSDKLYNLPDEVDLYIKFKDKEISTKAEHIRTNEYEGEFNISLKYKNLSDCDMDYISRFCFQKQLEYKRNSLD